MDEEDLDTWANTYQWLIEFQSLASVDAVLSTGPNLRSASNSTVVGAGQAFQYDALGNQLFVSFTANKSKKKYPDPSFTVRIALVTTPIPEEDREPLPDKEDLMPVDINLEWRSAPILVDLDAIKITAFSFICFLQLAVIIALLWYYFRNIHTATEEDIKCELDREDRLERSHVEVDQDPV